jgi:hypothetical protein
MQAKEQEKVLLPCLPAKGISTTPPGSPQTDPVCRFGAMFAVPEGSSYYSTLASPMVLPGLPPKSVPRTQSDECPLATHPIPASGKVRFSMSNFLDDPIWNNPVLHEMRAHWRKLCQEKDAAASMSPQAYDKAQAKERSWACMMWAMYREIRREQQAKR